MKDLALKWKKVFALIFVGCVSFLLAMQANAYPRGPYVPVALCKPHATNQPLEPFVCCEQLDRKGRHIFSNSWVLGDCSNVSPSARGDMGCNRLSPVYGTDHPILASCQFSASTGKYY